MQARRRPVHRPPRRRRRRRAECPSQRPRRRHVLDPDHDQEGGQLQAPPPPRRPQHRRLAVRPRRRPRAELRTAVVGGGPRPRGVRRRCRRPLRRSGGRLFWQQADEGRRPLGGDDDAARRARPVRRRARPRGRLVRGGADGDAVGDVEAARDLGRRSDRRRPLRRGGVGGADGRVRLDRGGRRHQAGVHGRGVGLHAAHERRVRQRPRGGRRRRPCGARAGLDQPGGAREGRRHGRRHVHAAVYARDHERRRLHPLRVRQQRHDRRLPVPRGRTRRPDQLRRNHLGARAALRGGHRVGGAHLRKGPPRQPAHERRRRLHGGTADDRPSAAQRDPPRRGQQRRHVQGAVAHDAHRQVPAVDRRPVRPDQGLAVRRRVPARRALGDAFVPEGRRRLRCDRGARGGLRDYRSRRLRQRARLRAVRVGGVSLQRPELVQGAPAGGER